MKKNTSIDRFALRRDKGMTPGARLDWLAAAREFAMGKRAAKKHTNRSLRRS
jgi:hypothetical protein